MRKLLTKFSWGHRVVAATRVLYLMLILLPGLALPTSAQLQIEPPEPPNEQGEADEIQEREEWFFEQRAYPLGYIPDGARQRALAERERIFHELPEHKTSPQSAPVEGDSWTNIGPTPIDTAGINFPGFPSKVSGRVTAIAVDPSNSSHWFIGAAQGGVWETTNTGANWTPKTDNQASLAIGAIAFAPSNSSIVYAGTGEGNLGCGVYFGAGVLKSSNGGNNWALVGTSSFTGRSISGLKVHPTNPNTILATSVYGKAGRGCENPSSFASAGIYKSMDGGVNWSLKLLGFATDIDVDPTNFNNQYATLGNNFGAAENGLYRSTSGGDTWTLVNGPWAGLTGGVGRSELAIAPSNPNTMYIGIQDAINSAGTDNGLLGLWRTDNAWATTPTWTQIPVTATDNGTGVFGYCGWDVAFNLGSKQCDYNHVLSVDPSNNNVLYAGGIALWKCNPCTSSPTWTEVSNVLGSQTNRVHVDQHAMAWTGSRLIVGNDGGVWSTTNGGSTWNNHNAGLGITQFYSGSVHPTNPNVAFGGAQDNGNAKFTGTGIWTEFFSGDGAESVISSSNPDTQWALSTQKLFILRYTTGSVTSFTAADTGIDKTGVPFIARLKKCPSNDDVLIAGTDNVWRTNNFFSSAPAKPTWFSNSPDPLDSGFSITAMAFAESDGACSTYAVGTASGKIFITFNGGASWSGNISNGVPGRYITNLAFDPTNANILYATLSGFNEGTPGAPGHIFKTTSATAGSPAWTNISPAVNIPFNAIVVDPFNPQVIHLGTDIGMLRSENGGTSWTTIGPADGIPNVAVYDLAVNHGTNTLIAFTHGRSAFKVNTAAATGADLAITKVDSPDPVTVGSNLTYTINVTNNGPLAATNVMMTDTLPAGVTFVSVTPSSPTCTQSGGIVTCNLGSLAASASRTITIVVTPTSTGNISNKASVSSSISDPNMSNNSTTISTTVNASTGDTLLRVDDGSFEQSIGFPSGASTAYFVNRLTPPSYPATLKNIQIFFGNRVDGLTVNTPIILLVGTNPSGSSNINGIPFQRFSTFVGFINLFNVYTLDTPVTINSGDFVVGFLVNNPPNVFPADQDTTPPSQFRSYISSDGTIFSIIDTFGSNLAGDFAIRATVSFGGSSCAGVTATFSPTSVKYRSARSKPTIKLIFKNGGTLPLRVTSVAPKPGLLFIITSISPSLSTTTIFPGKTKKFTIKTQGIGPFPLTVLGPYFTIFISCGSPGVAPSPLNEFEPLRPSQASLVLIADQLYLRANTMAAQSVQLQLFDLSGQLLVDRTGVGDTLALPATTGQGQSLANGVYLYIITVRGSNDELIRTEVRKLVINR